MRALVMAVTLVIPLLGCDRDSSVSGFGGSQNRVHPASSGSDAAPVAAPAPPAAVRVGSVEAREESEIGFVGLEASLRSVQSQQAGSSGISQTTNAPAMLIRTGHASVEIDSLEPAIAAVQALALRVGGFVANVGMQTGRTQLRQATLELKVPADRFDETVEGLRPLGRLESMNVSVADVGEEFTDVTARMNNARRLEERLLNLLATRTGKLEDILTAERELARVRQEIERYEGRLRYLRSRVALSTLHVTVHEPAPIIASAGRNPIVQAFREAWRNCVAFLAALIALSGILVPAGVIAAVVAVAWRRWGPDWGKGARPGLSGEAG